MAAAFAATKEHVEEVAEFAKTLKPAAEIKTLKPAEAAGAGAGTGLAEVVILGAFLGVG